MAGQSRERWANPAWWAARFTCLEQQDPVFCNLGITLAHYELSLALRDVLGDDTGANFHTWAVWGSHKAGTTIRCEDIPGLTPLAGVAGGVVAIAAIRRARPGGRQPSTTAVGAIVGSVLAGWLARRIAARSSVSVLGGNRIVLDDIGRATARYITTIVKDSNASPFLSSLRPGSSHDGGQDLLIKAFQHYDAARLTSSTDAKHEHMLYANLLAILHEHLRLQKYISCAIPRPLRRLVTARLLDYQVGIERLDVSRDVTPFLDGGSHPKSLQTIEHRDLMEFLTGPGGWDRSPNSLIGSAAADWTSLADRMNYIVDLFRSRHFDPALFDPPFTARQLALLRSRGVDCMVVTGIPRL